MTANQRSIDPAQARRRVLRAIRSEERNKHVVAATALLLALLAASLLWLWGQRGFTLGPPLAATALVGAILFTLIRIFGYKADHLQRGLRLVEAGQPRQVFLAPTLLNDLTGHLVELRDPDGRRLGLVRLKIRSKYLPIHRKGEPALAWPDQSRPDRFVFLVTARKALAATWTTARERERTWRRGKRKLVLGFAAGAVVMLAIAGWQYTFYADARAKAAVAEASATWPSVPGRVVSSGVEQVRIRRGKVSYPGYEARVHYAYDTGSRRTGRRIRFCYRPGRRRAKAEALAAAFPAGAEVPVYYDPRDPGRAVLQPGETEDCAALVRKERLGFWMFLGMGPPMLLLVGLVAVWLLDRRWKKYFRRRAAEDEPGR